MSVKTLLCQLRDIPEEGVIAIDRSGLEEKFSLILLRKNNQVYAYHNVCPHAGRRLDWAPGKFLLQREHIICAAHGAMFEVTTGNCVNGPCRGAKLRPCTVSIERFDETVYLVEECNSLNCSP